MHLWLADDEEPFLKLARVMLTMPRRCRDIVAYTMCNSEQGIVGGCVGGLHLTNIQTIVEKIRLLLNDLSPPCLGKASIKNGHVFFSDFLCFPLDKLQKNEQYIFDIVAAKYSDTFGREFNDCTHTNRAYETAVYKGYDNCKFNEELGNIMTEANMLIMFIHVFVYKLVKKNPQVSPNAFNVLSLVLDKKKQSYNALVTKNIALAPVLKSVFYTWQTSEPDTNIIHKPTLWMRCWPSIRQLRSSHMTFAGQRAVATKCFATVDPDFFVEHIGRQSEDVVAECYKFLTALKRDGGYMPFPKGFLYGAYIVGNGIDPTISARVLSVCGHPAVKGAPAPMRMLIPYVFPASDLMDASKTCPISDAVVDKVHRFLNAHIQLSAFTESMDVPMSSWMMVFEKTGMSLYVLFEIWCPHLIPALTSFERFVTLYKLSPDMLRVTRHVAKTVATTIFEKIPEYPVDQTPHPGHTVFKTNGFMRPQEVIAVCETDCFFDSVRKLTRFLTHSTHVQKRIVGVSKDMLGVLDVHHMMNTAYPREFPGFDFFDQGVIVENSTSIFLVMSQIIFEKLSLASQLLRGIGKINKIDVLYHIITRDADLQWAYAFAESYIFQQWDIKNKKNDTLVSSTTTITGQIINRLTAMRLSDDERESVQECVEIQHVDSTEHPFVHGMLAILLFSGDGRLADTLSDFQTDKTCTSRALTLVSARFADYVFKRKAPVAVTDEISIENTDTTTDAWTILKGLVGTNGSPRMTTAGYTTSVSSLVPFVEQHKLSALCRPENVTHPAWSPLPDLINYIVLP